MLLLLQRLTPMLAVEEVEAGRMVVPLLLRLLAVVVAGRTTLLLLQSLPMAVGKSTCLDSWGTKGHHNTTVRRQVHGWPVADILGFTRSWKGLQIEA